MDQTLHQQYEDIFSVPQKMLLYIGIKLKTSEDGKPSVLEKFQTLWFGVVLTHCTIGTISSLIWLFLELRSDEEIDFLLLTAQLMCTVYLLLGLMVMIYIFKNSQKFARTMAELSLTFRDHCMASEEQLRILTFLARTKKQMKSFLIINYVALVLFYIIPLIMLALGKLSPKDLMTKPPFRVWIPFDKDSHYQVIYLSLFAWGLEAVHVVVLNIILLCLVVSQLCLHFEFTARKLKTIQSRCVGEFNIFVLISEFKGLIREHSRLLDLSKSVSDRFSLFLLGNYIFNSFIICLIGFQIAYNNDFDEIIPFITFAFCILVQTLLVSYCGSRITEEVSTF